MPAGIANPYANLSLLVPSAYRDDLQRYSARFATEEGEKKDADRAPFERYVDLWWAGVGIGFREGRLTEPEDPHRFITGVVFNADPWRIVHLELLAIAHSGGTDILKTPGKVLDVANAFAATGLPLLVEVLMSKTEPIWDVSNFLRDAAKKEDGLTI